MLLPIRPETARCAIFQALNDELGYFLNTCVTAKRFGSSLFSTNLRAVINDNKPTKDKFKKLWDAIKPLGIAERTKIATEFSDGQFIQRYYGDKGYQLPVIPDVVSTAIADLTKHLFSRTSGLVGTESACLETLHEHFDKYRRVNQNICCFCGASELAPVRAGIEVNDQWRSANDHLLSKKDYPIFAVHPDNLVPTCETCNSKAKLAENLLIRKRKGHPNERRLCFFPFVENCNEYIGIEVKKDKLRLTVRFTMDALDPDVREKLNTWNDVYRIRERVEGKFTDLAVLADNDCPANNLNEFRQRIEDKATSCKTYYREESWNFWKYRFYEWLHNYGNGIVEALWDSIMDKRNDPDAAAIYGI